MKKKLLIIAGSGASVECGIPSVSEINTMFDGWCSKQFVAVETGESYYKYLVDHAVNSVNFEEGLYLLFHLSSLSIPHDWNLLHTFLKLRKLSDASIFGGKQQPADHNIFRSIAFYLVDELLGGLRKRCLQVTTNHESNLLKIRTFLDTLRKNYELGIFSLNYDNVLLKAVPDLETGFNKNGTFEPLSVLNREKWNFLYPLHGSVHFDMQGSKTEMHEIVWEPDLEADFKGNSSGRNSQDNMENIPLPTTCIIAGYDKTLQIQRQPFRTYYAALEKSVHEADAFLILGYGFGDMHLNNALSQSIYNRKRNVVVIDYSPDETDPLQFREDNFSQNLFRAFRYKPEKMSSIDFMHAPPDVDDLKAGHLFEISRDDAYPLSLWHNGFLRACEHMEKLSKELNDSTAEKVNT